MVVAPVAEGTVKYDAKVMQRLRSFGFASWDALVSKSPEVLKFAKASPSAQASAPFQCLARAEAARGVALPAADA